MDLFLLSYSLRVVLEADGSQHLTSPAVSHDLEDTDSRTAVDHDASGQAELDPHEQQAQVTGPVGSEPARRRIADAR
jgi:hypothetical protein